MRTAFDSDVLIYAAVPNHPLGTKVRALLTDSAEERIGSVILLPELFIKPTRTQNALEVQALQAGILRLELTPVSVEIATYAISLGAAYGLRTPDALHLATAVYAGADRFLTNNSKDFKREQILELNIIYPSDLADA